MIEFLATVPTEAEFRRTLLLVIALGLGAFAVCGGILAGFVRSLAREGERGEPRFTRTSARWLAALIASLLAFSAVFVWFGS